MEAPMNTFGVDGCPGNKFIIIMPPRAPFSRDEALALAAYLVALADRSVDHKDFLAVLEAVECT